MIRWFFLVGVCVVLLVFFSFVAGVFFSCDGGVLSGFRCVEPVVVGVCEDLSGSRFVVPDWGVLV